jgi:ATP-dependent DNA helicase RecG
MQELDGGFIITLFKNTLTEEQLTKLGLNARQIKAVLFVKEKGKISNADYQKLFSVSKATATRDLTELIDKFGLLEKVGQTGAGTAYILKKLMGS